MYIPLFSWVLTSVCSLDCIPSSSLLTSNLSKSDQLLSTYRSPSTCNRDSLQTSCDILREQNANRKQNAFSAVLSTDGRVVGSCWEKLKPKGPKRSVHASPSCRWRALLPLQPRVCAENLPISSICTVLICAGFSLVPMFPWHTFRFCKAGQTMYFFLSIWPLLLCFLDHKNEMFVVFAPG